MTTLKAATAQPGRLDWELEIDGRVHALFIELDLDLVPYSPAGLPAALFAAMSVRAPLRVEEPIDPVFASHMDAIQDWYVECFPTWDVFLREPARVPVEAVVAAPGSHPAGDAVALFFSGGVDSSQALVDLPDVTHLIRINGFDSLHEDPELERQLARTAERLGKRLIRVRTNLRQLLFEHSSWLGSYGAALASVAHALAPVLGRIYISSGNPDASSHATGAHQDLDPLWGLEGLETVRVGGDLSRTGKVLRAAASAPVREGLRVCNEEVWPHNCGRCPKCLRVTLITETAGVRGLFPTFPPVLNLEDAFKPDETVYLEDGLTEAEEAAFRATRDPDLLQPLEDLLFWDEGLRSRAVVEIARRPRPDRLLAVVDRQGDLGEADSLLAILAAARYQDERTRIDVVVRKDGPGELRIPARAASVARLDELAGDELDRMVAAADMVLCAGWDAAATLPDCASRRAVVAADLPPGEPAAADAYFALSPGLTAGLANLGVSPTAIHTVAAAAWFRRRQPRVVFELLQAKSVRRHVEDASRSVLAADPVAAEALAGVATVRIAEPIAGATRGERGAVLEAADALVLLDPDLRVPILITEAMAYGCVVIAPAEAACGLIEDGRDGLLIPAGGDPARRRRHALELLERTADSPTGNRELRRAAIDAAQSRTWWPPGRALLDQLGELAESSPAEAPVAA